jgi:hypothetical protein
MYVRGSKASLLNSKGFTTVGVVCAAATLILIGKPLSDAWALWQREQSPGWRRAVAVSTSHHASEAFYRSRTAVAEAVAARTDVARRTARNAVNAAQNDFSHYMAKAADASKARRPEILKLKAQGETVIGHDCAQWVRSDQLLSSNKTSPKSRLLYFENCTVKVSALQQALDNQAAALIDDMVKATDPILKPAQTPRPVIKSRA